MSAPPEVRSRVRLPDAVTVLAESRDRPERFGVLFDAYYPDIHRYAHSRLDATLADDVASETFLIAFRKRAGFQSERDGGAQTGDGQVRAWLFGIATNLIRRHKRTELRRYRALARDPGPIIAAAEDDRIVARVTAQALRGELARALAGLATRDRDALLLVALAGLDYHQTAVALSVPYGTVCSRLNRARRKVREALGGDPTRHGETHQ